MGSMYADNGGTPTHLEYIPMHVLVSAFVTGLGRVRGARSRSFFNSFCSEVTQGFFTNVGTAMHFTMTNCPFPGMMEEGHRPDQRSFISPLGDDTASEKPDTGATTTAEKSMTGAPGSRLKRERPGTHKYFDASRFSNACLQYRALGLATAQTNARIVNVEMGEDEGDTDDSDMDESDADEVDTDEGSTEDSAAADD